MRDAKHKDHLVIIGFGMNGRTLSEIELRKKYGVSVLAIRRGETVLSNPGAETELLGQDVVVLLGTPDRITETVRLFEGSERPLPE
jgi:CPA2 family monovalent cation:H+ antiporter-2